MNVEEKESIVTMIQGELKGMLETAVRSVEGARDGMHIGSERTRSRGERGVMNEQAYLIAAQMNQMEQCQNLMKALSDLDLSPARRVRPGALLETEDIETREQETYFMVPGGMGRTIHLGQRKINLVSPHSPMGKALLDRRRGHTVEISLPGGNRSIQILAIS